MSKFYPKEDRKYTLCPWCGTKEDTRTYSTDPEARLRRGHRNWTCGSSKRGQLPWQSKDCKIIVLEANVYKLEEQIITMQEKIDELNKQLEYWKLSYRGL